jgi:prepilin-type N-terminal cleavage/methylation domain-containing protein
MEMVESWGLTYRNRKHRLKNGFTLIELSIVLVIIGLIVGGILVGQNLISAAGVRATITQIERYNTAANTFREKTGYLPGDIPATAAAQFGFAARGQYAGEGDGNGIIEGVTANAASSNQGTTESAGETVMFWVDLSTMRLIDSPFSAASSTVIPGNLTLTSSPSLASYLPQAKLGNQNWIFVYSFGGTNYFGMEQINVIQPVYAGVPSSSPSLSVRQAYDIDKKIDDGMPKTGNVTAVYLNDYHGSSVYWVAGGSPGGVYSGPQSSTSCFDNAGAGGSLEYSLTYSNGSGTNCALSFRFQ